MKYDLRNKFAVVLNDDMPIRRLLTIFLKKTRICLFIRMQIGHYRVRFYPSAQSASAWYDSRRFEREAKIYGMLVKPGFVCVDVGANVGLATIPMSLAAGLEGTVLSVEPDLRIARYLSANVALNRLKNVTVLNVAAGSHDSVASLSRCRADDMTHISVGDEADNIPVPLKTLDVLTKELDHIDFLKIDVEGFERYVLLGAIKTLEKTSLVLIEMSQSNCNRYGYDTSEICVLLQESGFHLFRMKGVAVVPVDDREEPGTLNEDIVCVRNVRELIDRGFSV